MNCESLFQILAASLSTREIKKLCLKYRIPLPDAGCSQVALYQLAHKQCHHDAPFARHVQRYLNLKHAGTLRRLAMSTPDTVRQSIQNVSLSNGSVFPDDIAGLLWALASDPRAEIRAVEQALVEDLHLFSHCLLLAQLQGEVQVVQPAAHCAASESAALRQDMARLTAEHQTLQARCQRLEQQNLRLEQDKSRLQDELRELAQRPATLQQEGTALPPRPLNHRTTLRELRKLRYQVDKLTGEVANKTAEIRHLQTHMAAPPAFPEPSGNDPTPVEPPPPPASPLPLPSLHGKTIAVIGGLDGAAAHYTQSIAAFGGDCLLYDGKQGLKRLAEVIKQADIVFCPVDCNSHSAALSTKKLCRRLQKSCYFLRSSGVSHLKEKLLEIASSR
jgi:hypothetical protein